MSTIKRPLISSNLSENGISEWDARLINSLNSIQQLTEMVELARLLGISGLLDLGCAKIACLLKEANINEL